MTATALETLGRTPPIQQTCLDALRSWQGVPAAKFPASGFGEEDAETASACTLLSALEGAEVALQVFRSEEPLLTAGRHMAQLIRSHFGNRRAAPLNTAQGRPSDAPSLAGALHWPPG